MFFVVRSNDSFNFPLGWVRYIVTEKAFTFCTPAARQICGHSPLWSRRRHTSSPSAVGSSCAPTWGARRVQTSASPPAGPRTPCLQSSQNMAGSEWINSLHYLTSTEITYDGPLGTGLVKLEILGSLSFRRQLRSPWFVFTSLVPPGPPPPSRPPPHSSTRPPSLPPCVSFSTVSSP